jgi:hypothetical protein
MPAPTVDRATYLARQLLTRMRSLETALRDDVDAGTRASTARREELVAKVLAIEADTTDGPTVQLVTVAMPPVHPNRDWSDREQAELAAFLRTRLGDRLG